LLAGQALAMTVNRVNGVGGIDILYYELTADTNNKRYAGVQVKQGSVRRTLLSLLTAESMFRIEV
jgi:hypothetical protein